MDFLNIWDLNFMPNFIFLFTMKENHPFTVKYDLHDLNKLILFHMNILRYFDDASVIEFIELKLLHMIIF
jgi:hypothetical protein